MIELKRVGLTRLAISLDGSNAAIHDEFRQVQGSFDHGLRILREAQEVGLTTQVNTVIRKANIDDMDAMTTLMTTLGVVFWEVFFLVPMGRAKADDVASAEEFEAVFNPVSYTHLDVYKRQRLARAARDHGGRCAAWPLSLIHI